MSIESILKTTIFIYPFVVWMALNHSKEITTKKILKNLMIISETNFDTLKEITDFLQTLRYFNKMISQTSFTRGEKIFISGYLQKHMNACCSPVCHIRIYFKQQESNNKGDISVDFTNFSLYRNLIKENINRAFNKLQF